MNSDDTATAVQLTAQLHTLITTLEASGQVMLPPTNHALLQSIVQAANHTFKTKATAIAIFIHNQQELEFIAADNIINQHIIGMRFPANRGIAGYVAMTGQPLIVSHVEEDARFNRTFAEQSGYIPQSILAVPLRLGEKITGVIELLDKVTGDSFTLQDMELLTHFAHQASLTIEQAQQWEQLQAMLLNGLKELVHNQDSGSSAELQKALDSQPPLDSELVRLAELIKEVSALGSAERDACRQILAVFRTYSQAKSIHRFGVGRPR
jgi:GAF domain-containing protein